MGPIQSGVNQLINTAAFGVAGIKLRKHAKNIEEGLKFKVKTTPENAAKIKDLDAQADKIRSEGLPEYKPVDPKTVDTSISDDELTKMVQNNINEMRAQRYRPIGTSANSVTGNTTGNARAVEEITKKINQNEQFEDLKKSIKGY